MTTSLRQRFIFIGALLTLISLGVNGFALWVQQRMSDQIGSQYLALQAVRNHLEGDMMHDALRADVFGALLSASDPAVAKPEDVKADLAEHLGNFQDAVEANRALPLPEVITADLSSVDQPLSEYIAAAQSSVQTALTDRAAAVAAMPAFLERFGALEDALGKISDEIVTFATGVQQESDDIAAFSRMALWAAFGVTVAIFLCLGIYSTKAIIGPLLRLTATIKRLAQGDLAVTVADMHRKDELGEMASAIDRFRANALEAKALREQQVEQERKAEIEKNQALRRMAETVEEETRQAVDTIFELTNKMAANAEQMSHSAETVSNNSQGVSAAATEALANSQTVSAAAEQLSISIQEISSQVANARRVAETAVQSSTSAGATIAELSEAVAKISVVTQLISEIASQTNLLALNATIEAARAGEAGKGFAVVASEVKNLANQTARATEDISQQIDAVKAVTDRAVAAVKEIGESIRGVEAVSSAIATAVEKQTDTTTEIARSVTEASTASHEVATRITEVSTEAGSTGARAGEVNQLSRQVVSGIEVLRGTLVRVVRTSTTEVDRRGQPRFAVSWQAKLSADGKMRDVMVENCSIGGAAIRLTGEAVRAEQVELSLAEFGAAIPATILSKDGERLRLRFDLAGQARAEFEAKFNKLVAGRTPLSAAA